jgi:hypothetical protein
MTGRQWLWNVERRRRGGVVGHRKVRRPIKGRVGAWACLLGAIAAAITAAMIRAEEADYATDLIDPELGQRGF